MRSTEEIKFYIKSLFSSSFFITKVILYWGIKKSIAGLDFGRDILDVGAGNAPYRFLFPRNMRYISTEINYTRRPTVVSDAHFLPFNDNAFDWITAFEVLEHVRNPEAVMGEFNRVMRPGGQVVITVPMLWGIHYAPHDYRRYTKYGLKILAENNGFNLEHIDKIGGLFTFFFARLFDIIAIFLRRLPILKSIKYRGHIVSLALSPFVILLFPIALLLDKLSPSDAFGWLMIARKK